MRHFRRTTKEHTRRAAAEEWQAAEMESAKAQLAREVINIKQCMRVSSLRAIDDAMIRISQIQVQLAQAQVTERIVTQYVDRVRIVREQADAIIREVPVYVPQSCDPDGRLPAGWRVLHDAAASGQPADPARTADAQPVAPDAAAETVARNYLTCRETAEQLTALQQWVREQAAVQP